MRALHKKLFRDLRRLWAQALAIALVMAAGAATLILGTGAYQSLAQTRASYYEANRFADVFANLTRAPKVMVAELAAIDGVAAVEPRIVKLALADLDGVAEPVSVLLVSLPADHEPDLNRIYLRQGRLPEPASDNEALVSDRFAKSHGLGPGASFRVLINGLRRSLRVTGTGLSPEFVYAVGPGDLMPDERRYGVVWMREPALAAAYDLDGAFSSLLVKLVPGASQAQAIGRLDAALARYGGQGAYGRKDQTSHAFLDAELKQLAAMSRILPPIFLVIAAFLVNMTLTRLIALEREQIGLLKALGYSSLAVARHYVEFAALIAVIGMVIGLAAGYLLGNGLTVLYARFFDFPFLVFSRNPAVYAIAAGATLAAAVLGALNAVRGVVFLPPATAMAPPAPARYRKVLGDIEMIGRSFGRAAVMSARHLTHSPLRSASSILGVALAVAVLVGSLWSFGSINYMIDVTFYRSARQDATISFANARPATAAYAVQHLPGILRAEPFRAVTVKIRAGSVERRLALMGRPRKADLSRVLDASLAPVAMPESGIVLSLSLAEILKVRTGDLVTVERLDGDRRVFDVRVAAIIEGYIGLTAFMDMDALNDRLGEGELISGTDIGIDPTRQAELFAALKTVPAASFITLQKAALAKFRDTVAQNITLMITVYVTLAAIIAFGVVYNFARISLSEQGRELASLRVLGFTRAEVSGLLLGEIAAVVAIAQPLGWAIGYGIAAAMVRGFSTELYRVPFFIGRDVYAYASLLVILATAVSALVVRRRIDRLDLIAVLKTRE
ncbi:MAG: FtsX-like permease family protein [Rhizobiales bacterium]|nr:FtsX-like permease family protein [Hyphomicrobiales bacterium]MBI3673738.1 FtsX-like permease family protein [Hyphomicrobiales bacterium]